jgi:hypothetical protein
MSGGDIEFGAVAPAFDANLSLSDLIARHSFVADFHEIVGHEIPDPFLDAFVLVGRGGHNLQCAMHGVKSRPGPVVTQSFLPSQIPFSGHSAGDQSLLEFGVVSKRFGPERFCKCARLILAG